ncbi:MAG TPA: low molecular weight protein-tyrosine-phosphatase [Ramlibacter sp.]|nr:low molecular weight protein-tyrosine-phosphatase [Ramlibacter sp.]
MSRFSILMVCTGNICRSPTAEVVLRRKVEEAGLGGRIHIASAGTHDYHVGSPADERSLHHARLRGYDLTTHRARQVSRADFERFDLILAMDDGHFELLEGDAPPQHRGKLRRLMEFAPPGLAREVADPYYGGAQGFESVLDHIEAACDGLLAHLRREHAV